MELTAARRWEVHSERFAVLGRLPLGSAGHVCRRFGANCLLRRRRGQAALVNIAGAWILVGCPPDAERALAQLGVAPAALDAVLVAGWASVEGWPQLCRQLPDRRPRLLGTAPVLQAGTDAGQGVQGLIVEVFNDSTSEAPLAQLAPLGAALRELGRSLALALAPCFGRLGTAPSEEARRQLAAALLAGNQRLLQQARAEAPRVAPAAARKLAASVASRTEMEGSMAPDCRMLHASVPQGACHQIANVGLMCLWSLLLASNRCYSLTWALEGLSQQTLLRWQFRSDLGTTTAETLARLLATLQGPSSALRMAEIGVFTAELSSQLLEDFPSLHMLLVDPYHLRVEGVSAEQQQGLAQSTLDVAFSRTQKARRRATHVVQHSEEAAQWVARRAHWTWCTWMGITATKEQLLTSLPGGRTSAQAASWPGMTTR
ncbi:unnamed protein product [Effrenium voratum]|nr:unnamed protein product [Effrenium voratum]